MNEEQITSAASILTQWNPLGEGARKVSDLNGYHTEAIDILMALQLRGSSMKPEVIVMKVLNEAFGLKLAQQDCIIPAQQIMAITGKKK